MERYVIPELMDNAALDEPRLLRALHELRLLNRLSLSHQPFVSAIRQFAAARSLQRIRVLDIASGGGDNLCRILGSLKSDGLEVTGVGLDINPRSVAAAQRAATNASINASFKVCNAVDEPFNEAADVVMCSLFLHHLSKSDAIIVLRKMREAARSLVLISDLLRSRLGLALAWGATRACFCSPIVKFDGPQSVRAAFTHSEMSELLRAGGMDEAEINTVWPLRLFIHWSKRQ